MSNSDLYCKVESGKMQNFFYMKSPKQLYMETYNTIMFRGKKVRDKQSVLVAYATKTEVHFDHIDIYFLSQKVVNFLGNRCAKAPAI